jgi:pyruvate formate lyase activating enzyme
MSKSREVDILADQASPEKIARVASELGCKSVAYTYNDPVIFMEYAIDIAKACREYDIKSVAVTAGYINQEPAKEFFSYMDAANVDLKAFTEDFYRSLTGGHLQTVLDTLLYLKHKTNVWVETTTLLIPGKNDSDDEINKMTNWVVANLGPDVPMHFTAFHPSWKMMDVPPTPASTLTRARQIALDNGVHYAYTGNVHDKGGESTYCHHCGQLLIGRDWYELSQWHLDEKGCCDQCGTACSGVFEKTPGNWGAKRQPVYLKSFA